MFIQYLSSNPRFFFAMLITVAFSICLHELGHGLMAIYLGDRTPIEEGRITLNPLVHMGPMSLICLVLAGISWGSMPINPSRMRGRHAQALVAIAGPLTNVLLAVLALVALGLWRRFDPVYGEQQLSQAADNGRYLLWVFGYGNVLLAFFNLLPVPPLDGSAIVADFSYAYKNLMYSIMKHGPMVMFYVTILLFSAAGMVIAPAARQVASWLMFLVSGGA